MKHKQNADGQNLSFGTTNPSLSYFYASPYTQSTI